MIMMDLTGATAVQAKYDEFAQVYYQMQRGVGSMQATGMHPGCKALYQHWLRDRARFCTIVQHHGM
jgi:hypothetical protein